MGLDRRITFSALLVVAACAACRRASPSATGSVGGGPQPSASVPADRLAPGEAPPGTDKAFDLVLPRGARVVGRFADTIEANVALPAEDVANDVRKQADGPAEALIGPNATVFPALRVLGADPGHHLHVTIGSEDGRTTLSILRVAETPRPEPEPAAEAMKKAGLNPDGTLIHPELQQ